VTGPAFPDAWMTGEAPLPLGFLMENEFPGRHLFGFGYCKPVIRAEALRDRIGGYAEGLHCGEDVLLLQTALFSGAIVGTVPGAHYRYRVNRASLSTRPGAYPDVSRVNKRIRQMDAERGGTLAELLAERQAAIEYDGFVWAAKRGRWCELAYFLREVPKRRLVAGLWRALAKRAGFPAR
jgi:hypothetical protein